MDVQFQVNISVSASHMQIGVLRIPMFVEDVAEISRLQRRSLHYN